MKEFDDIYLTWRPGQGTRRFLVGKLTQNFEGKFSFNYLKEGIVDAEKAGFSPYTEFPEMDKVYNGNVLDIFGQRLIKSERTDIQSFYDFWEIDPKFKDDKYYLLAHTQGLSTTDNFEFLADYNPINGLHFMTELANVANKNIKAGTLISGDSLRYELDAKNEHDQWAVKVFRGQEELGYIKKIHCKVFHKPGGENLKLSIKALDQNGVIKRIFVKVFNA